MRVIAMLLVPLVLALAAAARGDVSVEVANGDRVEGVVAGGDTVTLRVRVPAGTVLAVTADGLVSPDGPAVAPSVEVRTPADADAAVGRVVTKRARSSVKKLVLATTGEHRIVLRGPAGRALRWRAAVSWKEPKSFTALAILDPGETTVGVPCGAGAGVAFTVRPVPRSVAVARLVALETAGGAPIASLSGPADAVLRVPEAGVHRLRVANDGGEGTVTVSAKFKPRKTAPRSIDLSTGEFPAVEGGLPLSGAVIDEAGGLLVPEGTGLDGASLSIPAGALPAAAAIFAGAGAAIDANPVDVTQRGLGPTVAFGPSGLSFRSDVTITLPFSLAALAGDVSALRVVERAADGTLREIPPSTYVIDAARGTVSFPASHFTSYRVFGPRRRVRGDVDGDGWADLVVPSTGAHGEVRVFRGGAAFAPARDTDAALVVSGGPLFGADAATGDLNDDGVDDLVAMGEYVDGAIPGDVVVFFGGPGLAGARAASEADVTILDAGTEDATDPQTRLVCADVTGSGADDLILSRVRFSGNRGAVHVFAGGSSFAPSALGDAVVTIDGAADGDAFGDAVTAGDLSGDGRADVVAAGEASFDVRTFFGGATLASGDTTAADAAWTGTSPVFPNLAVADVTGDGVADLVVGNGYPFINEIRVFPGGGPLGGTDTSASILIAGAPARGFSLGMAVADVDGDGVADIASSCYDTPTADRTTIAIWRGGAALAAAETLASADWTIADEAADDDLGARIWTADVNGDGHGDLAASAPGNDGLVNSAGAVYVWFGGPGFAPAASAGSADVVIRGTRFARQLGRVN